MGISLGGVLRWRTAGRLVAAVALLIGIAGCDDDDDRSRDEASPSPLVTEDPLSVAPPTTTIDLIGAVGRALATQTDSSLSVDLTISELLQESVEFSVTDEQHVADLLDPYSSQNVTATTVANFVSFACTGGTFASQAANSLTTVLDQGSRAAMPAAAQAIGLVSNCIYATDPPAEQAYAYLSELSGSVFAYLESRPVPQATATTTTLPPPPEGSPDARWYSAICAGGGTLAGKGLSSHVKNGRLQWLGAFALAFSFSFCPAVLEDLVE